MTAYPAFPLNSKLLCTLLVGLTVGACTTSQVSEPFEEQVPPLEAPLVVAPAPEEDPVPAADLKRIEGATPAEVLAYMGAPTLVRRDDTVQVMSFETEGCVFEVIFYENNPDEYFRARHIGARDRKGKTTNSKKCLETVLDRTYATRP